MKKRKAYKPLYLAAQAQIRDLESKLSAVRRALAEVEEALLPLGRSTLESQDREGTDPISLAPLEFVAARAWINSLARIVADEPGYAQQYAWRERPIHLAR